jgi:hypothetical protein
MSDWRAARRGCISFPIRERCGTLRRPPLRRSRYGGAVVVCRRSPPGRHPPRWSTRMPRPPPHQPTPRARADQMTRRHGHARRGRHRRVRCRPPTATWTSRCEGPDRRRERLASQPGRGSVRAELDRDRHAGISAGHLAPLNSVPGATAPTIRTATSCSLSPGGGRHVVVTMGHCGDGTERRCC